VYVTDLILQFFYTVLPNALGAGKYSLQSIHEDG